MPAEPAETPMIARASMTVWMPVARAPTTAPSAMMRALSVCVGSLPKAALAPTPSGMPKNPPARRIALVRSHCAWVTYGHSSRMPTSITFAMPPATPPVSGPSKSTATHATSARVARAAGGRLSWRSAASSCARSSSSETEAPWNA